MRPPRNLDKFAPAEEAAKGLEQIAASIRERADINPLVKWHLNLSVWNPAWADEKKAAK
jgi:hypothetical protein